jgi:zinc transporter ZupT
MVRLPSGISTPLIAVAGLLALAGFGAQPPVTGLLVAVAVTAVVVIASLRMLARATALSRSARASAIRDAWLDATIMVSPTHTDARALMRPRPPSVAL